VKTELEGEDIVIKVSLSVQVDTEEVARAITLLKQSEDARTELVALKQELVHVQEELERANRALKATTSSEQARRLNQQRQELLDQAQSNGLVAQAWTEWVLTASLMTHPGMSTDNAQVQALLGVAGRLSPSNPHVAIARQVITTKAAPLPPQPPRPPQPGSATGMSAVPVPDEAGASRSLSNVHQLNPLLPDAMGPSPAVGSSVTIMQVPLQAGATVTRPSVSLGKMYQQVPSTKIDKPARSTLHTLQPVGASPLAPKGAKDSHSSNEEGQPQ
jgi:hypothetical protein